MPAPLQLKFDPDVDEAERMTDVVPHVRVPPLALAPGGVVFELTDAVAVLTHPFTEFVTVTVYMPAELTVGFAVDPPETIPGPAHEKLVPDVVDPERTTDEVAQVIVPPEAFASGATRLRFTMAVVLFVQPPEDGVMVTV
jgi:hypothetical protein